MTLCFFTRLKFYVGMHVSLTPAVWEGVVTRSTAVAALALHALLAQAAA